MTEIELDISKAKEILARSFAKPSDIAWAWEMLQKQSYKNDEECYEQILTRTKFIEGLNLPTHQKDGLPSTPNKRATVVGYDIREHQYVRVEDVKRLAIERKLDWLPSGSKTASTPNDMDAKPWQVADPRDPEPLQDWYIPARYFAREFVNENAALVANRGRLAQKIAEALPRVNVYKRGGKIPLTAETIKKALNNIQFE